MSQSGIWNALRPLAQRMAGAVREHEILRVAASIGDGSTAGLAEMARREILVWASNRTGRTLPDEAWQFRDFESLAGGRTSVGVRIESETADIWAIRLDDPDKTTPGRVWTMEAAIGLNGHRPPRFSLRLLISTAEEAPDIEPHAPGLVQQIAERCGLSRGALELTPEPWLVQSQEEADQLIEMLVDPGRVLPIFVLTVADNAATPDLTLLDAPRLARAVLGMGLVVILRAGFTWLLSNRFGRVRSVFGGAVRAYLPGFAEDANPYEHRLIVADRLATAESVASTTRLFRQLAAQESLRRTRLGEDVLAFAAIRSAKLQLQQQRFETEGASESARLQVANAQIEALRRELADERAALELFDAEHKAAVARAETAEAQLQAAHERVRQLLDQIRSSGGNADAAVQFPTSWRDFAGWVDETLAGRLMLTPAARRAVKAPLFKDVALAARCLLWLANAGREWFRVGGRGSIREVSVENGIRNAHCGADSFSIDWRGQRHKVEWHLKNGGNTRAREYCLRIYYFFDADSQQMIVAHMPEHRHTDAT